MMEETKEIAIIYKVPESDLYLKYVDENSIDKCGGIESWMINMAYELSKWYNVTVYCPCEHAHTVNLATHSGDLEYRPVECFRGNVTVGQRKFEYIILNRDISDLIPLIDETECCKKIICQAHDVIMKSSLNDGWSYDQVNSLRSPLIKRFIANSEWHRDYLTNNQGIPKEKVTIMPEGIDEDDFKDFDCDHEVDHTVLWTSAFNRLPEVLIDEIAPLVRERIPDFSVEICSYLGAEERFKDMPYVTVLPTLKRKELIERLHRHALWYQTGCFPETFCISMLEAAACGNDIVMSLNDFGPRSILKPFVKDIGLQWNWVNSPIKSLFNNSQFIIESKNRIIESILDYHKAERIEMRKKIRKYVLENYTWKIAAGKYRQMLESF